MNRCLPVLACTAWVIVSPGFAIAQSPAFPTANARRFSLVPTPQGAPGRSRLDWLVSATDHFDVTYTPELAARTERVGRGAERSYGQVKADLRHELSFRPLLVLFSTREELEQAVNSRTVPGNREHILVPLDAPPARIDADLVHELCHVFMFDISPSLDRSDSPRWVHEGLAEFERGDWDANDLAVLREMLRRNVIPRLSSLRTRTLAGGPRADHVVGHAAFDFLVARAGRGSLRRFLLVMREGSGANPTDAYLAGLRLPAGDFDRAFDEHLRARFR
jgi:hypothetical protein